MTANFDLQPAELGPMALRLLTRERSQTQKGFQRRPKPANRPTDNRASKISPPSNPVSKVPPQ